MQQQQQQRDTVGAAEIERLIAAAAAATTSDAPRVEAAWVHAAVQLCRDFLTFHQRRATLAGAAPVATQYSWQRLDALQREWHELVARYAHIQLWARRTADASPTTLLASDAVQRALIMLDQAYVACSGGTTLLRGAVFQHTHGADADPFVRQRAVVARARSLHGGTHVRAHVDTRPRDYHTPQW